MDIKCQNEPEQSVQPEQPQSLFHRILEAQEAERRRISRELHDEVGQSLTIIKLNAGLITRNLPRGQYQLKAECDELISYIDKVLDQVRRLARDLSPAILEDVGLRASLRALLHDFARGADIKVTASVENVDHLLSKKSEIILYRIVQESLANIARHAKATRVTVIGGSDGRQVSFQIEDDGIGFDLNHVRRDPLRRGLGIPIIIERVRMLGGVLDFRSMIGEGTQVRFTIPIGVGERDNAEAL